MQATIESKKKYSDERIKNLTAYITAMIESMTD